MQRLLVRQVLDSEGEGTLTIEPYSCICYCSIPKLTSRTLSG